MKQHATIVLLAAAILIAIAVAAQAEGSEPSGIFFEATRLTSEMEGTGVGQIAPFGAAFCAEGVCVVEPNAAISAYTQPFTDTTRVWVEHTSTVSFTVSFKSGEKYGLGQCEIGPAGGGRAWGYCDHDPLGDYEAVEVIVQAPQGTTVSGIAVAWPQNWAPPEPVIYTHTIYVPVVSR